MQIKTIINK